MRPSLITRAVIQYLLFQLNLPIHQVDARPAPAQTLLLSQLHKARPNASSKNRTHPALLHQQHVNHAIQRFALMTGNPFQSEDALQERMRNRIAALSSTARGRLSSLGDGDQIDPRHGSVVEEPLAIQANDVGYTMQFWIGTPPTSFVMLMDSGSADTWVGSTHCHSEAGGDCGHHQYLGHEISSTFEDLGRAWAITYGSGSVSGRIIHDVVTIDGKKLENFIMGIASAESREFKDPFVTFDGLIGCAKSSLSRQKSLTLVEDMRRKGLIEKPITSYRLPRHADDKSDGQVAFGGMNPLMYRPESLVTIPNINKRGFWEVAIAAILVNDVVLETGPRTAILDTGTTLILVSSEDAMLLHHSIPGAKFNGYEWTVPCHTIAKLSFVFAKQQFPIKPIDIARSPSGDNDGQCFSGIGSDDGQPPGQWLVGDVFLKNVYFSTDVDQDEVSLAKLS